jgi:hypothetical protein
VYLVLNGTRAPMNAWEVVSAAPLLFCPGFDVCWLLMMQPETDGLPAFFNSLTCMCLCPPCSHPLWSTCSSHSSNSS